MYNFLKNDQPLLVTSNDVKLVEGRFGIKFPQILKEYYLKFNGMGMNLCRFTINGNNYEVVEIIALCAGEDSFESIKMDELEDGFIPKEFMPLAYDRGGDYYYWDSKSESVYLVYPDCIEHPVYICHSVEAFFDLLENAEIE